MNIFNQNVLDEFILYLKKDKYKNKIQDLKLEYCTDKENKKYIYLVLIKVKKSQQKKVMVMLLWMILFN